MKRLCLIGPVDKRIIAYPLIKCLMSLGRLLVVSEDSNLRRFSEDYACKFDYGNSWIWVVSAVDDGVEADVRDQESNFEYVLYITTSYLPKEVDRVLYCHGVEKGFLANDTLKELENMEYGEVVITFSSYKDKSVPKILPNTGVMKYIFQCEDTREFLPVKSTGYTSLIERFFLKELDIPKATLKGLLTRKG